MNFLESVTEVTCTWKRAKPLDKYDFHSAWRSSVTVDGSMYICDGFVLAIDCKINSRRILKNRVLVRKLRNKIESRPDWSGTRITDTHVEKMIRGGWGDTTEKVVDVVPYQLHWNVYRKFRTYLLVTDSGYLGMVNAHKYRLFQALCYPNEVSFEVSGATPPRADGPFEYVKCKVGNVMVGCIAQMRFTPAKFKQEGKVVAL